jgi:hypothetical protein
MLSVIMMNVLMLSFIMLNVLMLSVTYVERHVFIVLLDVLFAYC